MKVEDKNLRNLFAQTPEMFCILGGPEHVFEFVNQAHIKILGFDATGKAVREAQPESVEVHVILDDVYKNGNTIQLHEVAVTVGSSLRYFDLTFAARKDESGKINGILILGSEVTARVLSKQQRDDFISMLSHDLRNPLAAAKISAQLINRTKDMPDKVQVASKRIVENLNRANSLIENLLDANKIKAGVPLQLEMEPVMLNTLVDDVIVDLSTVHGKRFVIKNDSSSINGHWSPEGIRRILENLCINAVKYGAPNTPIEVRFKNQNNRVSIEVHNEGNPIPIDVQEKLFDLYQRNTDVTRGVSGWGLGLTLVKGVAEAHGGMVEVKSKAGDGTTFTVLIPLDSREHNPSAT